MEVDHTSNPVNKWFLYDMGTGEYDYDLVRIVSDNFGHYVMQLFTTDGYIYPGIVIASNEFHKHALQLSDEQAMLERLKRGYNES